VAEDRASEVVALFGVAFELHVRRADHVDPIRKALVGRYGICGQNLTHRDPKEFKTGCG
jgi:hypothetical protein